MDLDIVEDYLGGLRAAHAHLVLALPKRQTFGAGLHHEERLAPVALAGIVAGQNGQLVGVFAVGDEYLGAVDDVIIAIPFAGSPDSGYIGPGSGLGHCVGGQLAFLTQVRIPIVPLFLSAPIEYGLRGQHVGERGYGNTQAATA